MMAVQREIKKYVFTLGGLDFKMIEYDGVRFSQEVFRPDFEREIGELPCREDDVFLVIYPKSGRSHATDREIEYIGKEVRDFPICYQDPEYLTSLPSPRVLHTHMPFRFLPKQHLQRRGKVITLFRNPKDNCVSNWHFISGICKTDFAFQDFLDAFYNGKWTSNSWYEWRDEWVKMRKTYPDYPVLVVRYEDMVENLYREVKRISAYLELNHSEEFLQDVVKACGFKAMKAGKVDLTPDDALKYISDGYDLYYRKGVVGDWKRTFTVAQSENFDEWMKKEIKDDNKEFPNYLDFYK